MHLLAQSVKHVSCHLDILFDFSLIFGNAHAVHINCIMGKLFVSKNRKRRQLELKGKQAMRKNIWKRRETQSKQNN